MAREDAGMEITLNLWYVVDDLGVIYSLRARTYVGRGSKEEKLRQLQDLASVDYLIASIYPIPGKYHTQIDGQRMPVFLKAALDHMNTVELFEEAITDLQSKLPAQTPLDIPDNPLVCITPLLGNDADNIRPFFTETERS